MSKPFTTTAYRIPSERLILLATFVLVLAVIVLTSAATFCGSAAFILIVAVLAYTASNSHHNSLIQNTYQVTPQNSPELARIIQESADRLQVEPVHVFVYPSRILNAYTFGFSSPKAIVLYQSLFQIMDVNELQFIIGHEMGHICLGHTWLNSLVGGMAGIPASAPSALLLVFALRWWNRACEYSADRAGLLACSKPEKAISALIKLEAAALGEGSFSQANLAKVLQRIEASDDHWTDSMEELLTTHPMMIKRINQIRLYSVSTEYQTLQKMVNTNLH